MNLKEEILKDLKGVNLRLVKYFRESRYQKRFKPEYREQEVWIYTKTQDLGHCITESEFKNKANWEITKEMIIGESLLPFARSNRKKIEKEKLEGILHPTPTINGVDIIHRHVGRRIIFEGWNGERKLCKGISYSRAYILDNYDDNEEFYERNMDTLRGILE